MGTKILLSGEMSFSLIRQKMEQAASEGKNDMDILKLNLEASHRKLKRTTKSRYWRPDLKSKENLWLELIKCVEAGRLTTSSFKRNGPEFKKLIGGINKGNSAKY